MMIMLVYVIVALVLLLSILDLHLGYGFSLFGWLLLFGYFLIMYVHLNTYLVVLITGILFVIVCFLIVKNNRNSDDKTKYTFELVGKEGIVKRISNDGTILIELDGDTWIAYPENDKEKFKINDVVIVTEQNGLKLKIKKKE